MITIFLFFNVVIVAVVIQVFDFINSTTQLITVSQRTVDKANVK